jgi:aryl sulfotransferase
MTTDSMPQRTQHYRNFMVDSARWDNFKFRDGDIIISTPPKSGTTWTQMICAQLIFQKPELDEPLTALSPWIDMDAAPIEVVLAQLEAQTHRRFIKTHTPLDGLPYKKGATYLCVARDPRDAFMSMDGHHKNMRPEFIERMLEAMNHAREDAGKAETESSAKPATPPTTSPVPSTRTAEPTTPEEFRAKFRDWIADDGLPWRPDQPMSAPCVLHHTQTFWTFQHLPNIHMTHYSDLLRDLEGQMRGLAANVDIEIDEAVWPALIEAATFENMKGNAEMLVPEADKDMWTNNQGFFNKGTGNQWQGILGDEELALYHAALKERLDPELARWLENGSL